MQRIHNGGFVPVIASAALSQSLTGLGWNCLDGIEIPSVQRGVGQKFFPVRIAESKFLSQFVDVAQFDVPSPVLSHYMNEAEAVALTNSGCGEIFTVQDLLVNIEEFKRFYEEIKQKCTRNCSKKASVDGGWVQINNTVVPFIVKDESAMVSLDIVRCAAGLLVGRDVPVVYPDVDDCRFLNESCKSAGISFEFTTATELVEMELMSCMSDQRPIIQQLSGANPFSVAQPVVVDSSKVNAVAGVSDTIPINLLSANKLSVSPPPYSGLTYDQQPWPSNGSHSTCSQTIINGHSLLPDVRECKPLPTAASVSSAGADTQFLAQSIVSPIDYLQSASIGSEHLPPYQNPVVTSALGGSTEMLKEQQNNLGVQQKCDNNQTAMNRLRQFVADVSKRKMAVIASDASKEQPLQRDHTMPNSFTQDTAKPLQSKLDKTKMLHESATDEEKQMQITQNVQGPPTIVSDADDLRAGENLLLRRIQCYGKMITCMIKHDKLYILLEAMNRLYFPMRRLDTVIKAVTESLHVPVTTLTDDEERDFMTFYKLPAKKLNSNKVINVDDFVRVYRSLQCMLENSVMMSHSMEPKAAVESPAAVSGGGSTNSSIPVPVGLPVLNISNTEFHQSQTAATNANNHSVVSNGRLPNMAQSYFQAMPMDKPGEFVNDMPKNAAVNQNASENSRGQKPPKRCRRQVIGEVIFIDD